MESIEELLKKFLVQMYREELFDFLKKSLKAVLKESVNDFQKARIDEEIHGSFFTSVLGVFSGGFFRGNSEGSSRGISEEIHDKLIVFIKEICSPSLVHRLP